MAIVDHQIEQDLFGTIESIMSDQPEDTEWYFNKLNYTEFYKNATIKAVKTGQDMPQRIESLYPGILHPMRAAHFIKQNLKEPYKQKAFSAALFHDHYEDASIDGLTKEERDSAIILSEPDLDRYHIFPSVMAKRYARFVQSSRFGGPEHDVALLTDIADNALDGNGGGSVTARYIVFLNFLMDKLERVPDNYKENIKGRISELYAPDRHMIFQKEHLDEVIRQDRFIELLCYKRLSKAEVF